MDGLIQSYYFLIEAFWVALIVGCVAPLMGTIASLNRTAHISGAISHMTLAGIAFGTVVGSSLQLENVSPLITGTLFGLIGAWLTEWLRKSFKGFSEAAIPVVLSFGLALGSVIFSAVDGFNAVIYQYLFGNLLAATTEDVIMTVIVGNITIFYFIFYYKEIMLMTFDSTFAKVTGLPVNLLNSMATVILALVITITVQMVGVLLVAGLMILPSSASLVISRSFKQLIFLSVIIGEIAVLMGTAGSIVFNISTGGAIITSALLLLITILAVKKAFNHKRRVRSDKHAH